MKRVFLPIFFLSLTTFDARALTSFETPRTLPDGAFRFQGGIGVGSSAVGPFGFQGELGCRLGLSPSLDFGLLLSFPQLNFSAPTIMVDLCFLLASGHSFALSLGLGLSYLGATAAPVHLTQISFVPELNLGYDLSKSLGAYLSIRDQAPTYFHVGGTNGKIISVLTPAVGMRLGDTWGCRLEGGYSIPLNSGDGSVLNGVSFFLGKVSRFAFSPDSPTEKPNPQSVDQTASKLIAILEDQTIVLSQPEKETWKTGARVCLFKASRYVACGKIIKSDSAGAQLKYDYRNEEIRLGQAAGAEPNEP